MAETIVLNPLHELHTQAGAEFQFYDNIEIVSTFGEPQAEYAAIRKGTALFDLAHRGLLELTGKDRLPFLNNLLTNQTFDKSTKTGLTAGQGVYAFLLNAKSGRIIADMNVIERGDRTLLEMDARLIPTVKSAFQKYLFAEQVKISDAMDRFHEFALHGPTAAGSLPGLPKLELNASAAIDIFGVPAVVWRDDPTGAPGYHLIVPIDSARAVWMQLVNIKSGAAAEDDELDVERLPSTKRRVRPAGWAVFNAARIENGRPIFGIDFDDTILPAETGQLPRALSFTKGCYPGQEIVARMHARQQVARQIAGLKFADDSLPIASTISPMLSNSAVAIVLLKRPHFAVGTVVNVPAEGEMRKAVVTEMPFVKTASSG
jgi:folate-binding protein YgfZ